MIFSPQPIVCFFLGLILLPHSLWLIVQGKFHLGISLVFSIAIGLLVIYLFKNKIKLYLQTSKKFKYVWNFAWLGFYIWLVSIFIFFMALLKTSEQQALTQTPQVIIVLGSGIEGNKPSATLAQRLDQAALIFKQYPQSKIIVSGGVGFKKQYSEAQIMADYLNTQHQIPLQNILEESQSTSTYLNLANSKPILKQQHISLVAPIAIVTSDFHTLRAKAIAIKLGYQYPIMISAPTPFNLRYYSWIREYFAFLSGWLFNEY